MKQELVEIHCCGYFEDEHLTNFSRIEEVMTGIEQGSIRRPEFEVVFPRGGKKPPIYVSALFREGGKGLVEGWFLCHLSKGAADNVAYCARSRHKGAPEYKPVVRSGAPQLVDVSAILSKAEAVQLLEFLAKGEAIVGFDECSYLSALCHEDNV
jgi:hypothetical protein